MAASLRCDGRREESVLSVLLSSPMTVAEPLASSSHLFDFAAALCKTEPSASKSIRTEAKMDLFWRTVNAGQECYSLISVQSI